MEKFEYCQVDRDISKVLTFRAPDIINIAVRHESGYLINQTQKKYRYLYDHPVFTVDEPFVEDFRCRFLANDQIEF